MESLNGGVTSSSSKSKEEEKAASSYTYWVRNKTEAAAPLPVPQKLQQQSSSVTSSHQLGSAWNRAGTWEEKSLNHWAIPRIKVYLLVCYNNLHHTESITLSFNSFIHFVTLFQELLISVGSISFSSGRGTAQVQDVTKCVGDVSLFYYSTLTPIFKFKFYLCF
jgi:hypothetical protein